MQEVSFWIHTVWCVILFGWVVWLFCMNFSLNKKTTITTQTDAEISEELEKIRQKETEKYRIMQNYKGNYILQKKYDHENGFYEKDCSDKLENLRALRKALIERVVEDAEKRIKENKLTFIE